ncbi:hypothetical protein CLI64_18855 [Nostoc sp. CENA543]|uniref:hypothetical protein n=1 Tax=Nostoc sp. CENA543 TaxID=1869241 RepID=UPI000CA3B3DB|nr:hypothetical protein [Nostoc sp. CENA543]AUT02280.1 hypothetical protein CLI64_18855 [Nostoc sp. CENA543]
MNLNQEEQWIKEIRQYCRSLNISTSDLYKIVTDLKVAPMIRGKAFEFSMYSKLKQILPSEDWTVVKPIINAQTGNHDIDIMVMHNKTKKIISVECKLAGKGMFSVAKTSKTGFYKKGDYLIKVKCMRSRTTKTPEKVNAMAQKFGVSPQMFLAHSDQYRVGSFDVVATSVGNAFYQTLEDNDGNLMYTFEPSEKGLEFIKKFQPSATNEEFLQEFVYNKVYLACSLDITVSHNSGVICSKQACSDKHNCGFIPNYPIINFGNIEELPNNIAPSPINSWVDINNGLDFFESILDRI